MSLEDSTYKIRPAARLIHTIGSDLIGDVYAAIVELVKNSYDADASLVDIKFIYTNIKHHTVLNIVIEDDGHGMSFDTVINKWLVPATNDKLKKPHSKIKGRTFQGRKGIGRFAASILGQEMTLSTVDEKGEKSTVVIDWSTFNSDTFLENIEILVENEKTSNSSGTQISIVAWDAKDDNKLSSWDRTNIDNLINELRKLISPFKEIEDDPFKIKISFISSPFEELNNKEIEIDTYPIIDLFDYRISGTVNENGHALLLYENNVTNTLQAEKINTNIKVSNGKYCGNLTIDFRVFDREPEALDNLIEKGLYDPLSKRPFGKNEVKAMLNDVYGVNIYKNHFRIRPYGNGGIDWLDLDKDRIQNFTLRISNNQIVGFITIEPEEKSHLEEKSARDGLKENEYYQGLKEISRKVLHELEVRRLIFRERSQRSRKGKKSLQNNLINLFSFSDLTKNIEAKLEHFNVSKENISQIKTILKQEEANKTEVLESIQKTLAIYQGQATLGKIVSFILHEGRKPIQFFNSETIVIERYIRHYKATHDEELLNDLTESLNAFKRNSKLISDLFKRVNPLASQRRTGKKHFPVHETLKNSHQIFRETISTNNIICQINCDESLLIYGWDEDLFIAITNLIENSVYWLENSDKSPKTINIDAYEREDAVIIDVRDNGPGLKVEEIETDIIFEPGYSNKHNGTGLGLAIAGEAVERLNGKLKAKKTDVGAHFQIEVEVL